MKTLHLENGPRKSPEDSGEIRQERRGAAEERHPVCTWSSALLETSGRPAECASELIQLKDGRAGAATPRLCPPLAKGCFRGSYSDEPSTGLGEGQHPSFYVCADIKLF